MSIPTIPLLPDAPSRNDSPSEFTTKANDFLASLNTFNVNLNRSISQMNAFVSNLDNAEYEALEGYMSALSRATASGNLVINGSAEHGSNLGFEVFDYDSSDSYIGAGCFVSYSTERLFSTDLIPINDLNSYLCKAAIKASSASMTGLIGLAFYTADKQVIASNQCWRDNAYNTTLAQPVVAGDTEIVINTPALAWSTLYHSCVQFNVATDHSDLPNRSAVNIRTDGHIDNGDGTMTIRLGYVYNGSDLIYTAGVNLPAGTPVGNVLSGSAYSYCLLSGLYPSTQWFESSGLMRPHTDYSVPPTNYQIRKGARFARFFFQLNRNNLVDGGTVKIDGLVLKEIDDEENTPVTSLSFPQAAVASSDANTLDDYEEGNWTPLMADGVNWAGGTVAVGRYTKIGRQVHVKGRLLLSVFVVNLSGNIRIEGLPFNSSGVTSTDSCCHVGYAANLAITAGHSVSGYIPPGASYINLRVFDAAGGTTAMQASELTTSSELIFDATYYV